MMRYKIREGREGLFRPAPVERTDGKFAAPTLCTIYIAAFKMCFKSG